MIPGPGHGGGNRRPTLPQQPLCPRCRMCASMAQGQPHGGPVPPGRRSGPPTGAAKLGPVIDVGTVLRDRYEITGLLAHGGMADVFSARDRALERTVAVKVVRGTTPDQRQRLEREALLLARFEHPN